MLCAPTIAAQKRIDCSDGIRYEIDLRELAIEYQVHSFSATLSSFSILGSRLGVEPKTVQKAEAATQVWNEYLKGLVVGYNSCAITKEQYAEGLQEIYPRLKEDAASLEKIRQVISEGKQADEKRLRRLLESYLGNLQRFAEISNQEIVLERVDALIDESTREIKKDIATTGEEIKQQVAGSEKTILQKLGELKRLVENVAPPSEVKEEISELRATLLAKVDDAEAAYEKGYDLLQRFRFREAIPYFETALKNLPTVPDFYVALGTALLQLPDLGRSESILRQGLAHVAEKDEEKHEASLANLLGLTLKAQGGPGGGVGVDAAGAGDRREGLRPRAS